MLDYTAIQVISSIIGIYPLLKIFVLFIIFVTIFLSISAVAVLKCIGLIIGIFFPFVFLFWRPNLDVSKIFKKSEKQEGNNANTTK